MGKPEDVRMTKEESEKYGQQIDAKNVQFEKVALIEEEHHEQEKQLAPPLSEVEIKRLVGEQNYKNVENDNSMGAINS